MKHIFIANPAAGPVDSVPHIRAEVEKLRAHYDCEIYETRAPGDAIRYIRAFCDAHPGDRVRFYACGGDGTLNEVLNGAIGYPEASISVYPCGSGNDFVKYYGAEHFLSIPALLEGEEHGIDVLTNGESYAINIANFGFEYFVCDGMEQARRRPLFKGKNAYTYGIARALLHCRKNRAEIYVDGKLLNEDGMLLLGNVANGSHAGGGYRCAPRSDNEDGLLEVCLFPPVSVLTFLSLIGDYKKGTHLENPRFKKLLHYTRGKEIRVLSDQEGFGYVFDGQIIRSKDFTLRVLPKAIRFAVPPTLRKSKENSEK